MTRRRWWPAHWRFLRWAVPLTAVVALFTITGVTWMINRVTPADRDYLEPSSAADVGSRAAARSLASTGVPVQRYGNSLDALAAARAGGRTVLVTAPDYVDPSLVYELFTLPSADRVVLVAPSALLLSEHDLPIRRTGSRWTTGAAEPGCRSPLAAGRAAALGARYALADHADGTVCYDGGLVRTRAGQGPELVVIGAPDVLRNDRIGELRNAALARALLSGRSGVVWLSLHRPETLNSTAHTPPAQHVPTQDPLAGHGHRHTVRPSPGGTANGDGDGTIDGPGGQGTGSGQSSGDGGSPPNPLWSTFPPWLWAITAQLLVAAVLLALWRARRFGPPVSEPLPVVVRAGETVTGRARLYQAAKARPAALGALRDGALRRLTPLLGLGANPGRQRIVAALAERVGWPPERVDAALYGVEPDTDAELRAAVYELDLLVWLVHEEREGTAGAGAV